MTALLLADITLVSKAICTTIAPYLIVVNFDLLAGTPKGESLFLASTAIIAFLIGIALYQVRERSVTSEALADLAEEIM